MADPTESGAPPGPVADAVRDFINTCMGGAFSVLALGIFLSVLGLMAKLVAWVWGL